VATVSGAATPDFFRLFLAPGVGHCGGGNGPAPADPLTALVAWVEEGHPPDALPALQRDASGAVVRERPLCPYPSVAVHDGSGDPDLASSFVCADDFPSG
jgi:feruloyl esterase